MQFVCDGLLTIILSHPVKQGVSRGEIILVSASLLCTIGVYSWGATTIQTLNSICALVFTNSLLMWVLEHVRTGSSIDGLSIIVIVIVMAKIFVRLESRFLG